MTAKFTIANDASDAPLNVTERSSAPSSPNSNDIYLDDGTNTASGNPGLRRYTGAAWEDVSASSGGTIGGSTGATDNAVLAADGTGGSTLQARGVTIDDSDNVESVNSLTSKNVAGLDIKDQADNTKVARLDVSGIKTSTTRTLTVLDRDTTIGETIAENTSVQTIDRIPRIGGTHDAFGIFTAWRDAADASNPVVPTGATSTSDDKIRETGNILYEPWDPERPYKMFYTGYDAGASTDEKIHYAYSKNGTDWTKFASNPVISDRAEDPYVLYKDGTYYMYVEDKANQGANGNIRRYSSTDCETWVDDGQITLNTDDEQSPTVWIEGDTWYMLYEQYPATPNDIRLATSSDGLTWTNSGSNPVFSPGDVSWDTVDDVVPDDILLIDGTYYMSYHSAGPTNGIYKSGIATSTDLINWTDLNGAWTYTGWADGQTHLQFVFDGRLRFYVIKSLDFTTGIYEVEMDVPIVAIASDAITASSDYILLQAQTGSTDDLATINGGKYGQSLVLKADSGETITLKHATGNIHLNGGADFELSSNVAIELFYDGTNWTDLGAGGGGSGTDDDAIHDNVAGEINALTEKVSPVNGDWVLIEDSADSNNKKKAQVGNLPGGGGSGIAAEIVLTAAGAALPTTNGAARGTIETATNAVLVPTLDFDQSTDEYAQWAFNMPTDWDAGTVTAIFNWSAASGSGDVVWALQGVSLNNDDAIDTAFGTAQTVTDTLTATGDLCQSAATSAMTLANTPAAGDLIVLRAYRDADNGSDTLSADAQLISIVVSYTRS